MNTIVRWLMVICTGSALAHEPGAHVHGLGKLDVALDGDRLEVHFESPLDNLLGFEHAPRTDAEHQAVQSLAQRFRQSEMLFVSSPEGACARREVALSSSVLPMALLVTPDAAYSASVLASSTDEDGHADLDVTLIFTCARPALIKRLEVSLFAAFPRLRQVDAQMATGRGQSSAKLTPQRRMLIW